MPWLLPALVFLLGCAVFVFARRRRGRLARRLALALSAAVLLLAIVLVPINMFAAGKMGDLRIGPFPKGTPVNLIVNMNPHAPTRDLLAAVWTLLRVTSRIERENLSDDDALRVFEAEVGPALLKVSKNPDWVRDRGHYFPSPLPDPDKRALKEFLKTF
jgi:hypothetical protein